MGIVRQYKCDGCGALKREANHWWALGIDAGGLFLCTLERYEGDRQIFPVIVEGDATLIFCGQKCATERISAAMGQMITAKDNQADGVKE